jgi:hypothetical protein
MRKALALLLLTFPQFLLAAATDEVVHAPSETVSVAYVVAFVLIFFGMIGGFFVYLWWNEKHKKPE